ncbi:MAG TPA: hypothetical protein VER03_01055 [Bryobacteraceae bacterium]|nr:hypothetical protein [Bryobacteraceae bacterium]
MNADKVRRTILANAAEIVRLHNGVRETFRRRGESEARFQAWKSAAEDFQARYRVLAFPGGYEGALERIESGDPNAVEAALCFLELRPYFFRSGYLYEKLLPRVKHALLSLEQAERLRTVLRRRAEWRARGKYVGSNG